MSSSIARLGDRVRSPDASPAVVDVSGDDAAERGVLFFLGGLVVVVTGLRGGIPSGDE